MKTDRHWLHQKLVAHARAHGIKDAAKEANPPRWPNTPAAARISYPLNDRQEILMNGWGEFTNDQQRIVYQSTQADNEVLVVVLRPSW
jgi:hypothetical protein